MSDISWRVNTAPTCSKKEKELKKSACRKLSCSAIMHDVDPLTPEEISLRARRALFAGKDALGYSDDWVPENIAGLGGSEVLLRFSFDIAFHNTTIFEPQSRDNTYIDCEVLKANIPCC